MYTAQAQADDGVFQGSDSCRPGAVAGDSLGLRLVRRADEAAARFELLIDAGQRCISDEPRGGPMGGPPPGGPPPGGAPRGPPPGTPPFGRRPTPLTT